MHFLIAAIVPAHTKEEALARAKNVFEQLCDETRSHSGFDYYETFEETKNSWDGLKAAYNLTKELETGELVGKLLKTQNEELKNNFEKIKNTLESGITPEKIWKEKDDKFPGFRYICWKLGQEEGLDVRLYDENGEGLTTLSHLERALNIENDIPIWVVPANIHY